MKKEKLLFIGFLEASANYEAIIYFRMQKVRGSPSYDRKINVLMAITTSSNK